MSADPFVLKKYIGRTAAAGIFSRPRLSLMSLATLGLYSLDSIWFMLSDRLSLDLVSLAKIWAVASVFLVWEIIVRLRRTGHIFGEHPPLSGRIMFAQIIFTIPALGILNHLSMSLNFPLADDLLANWDQNLGFDWFAYANLIGDHPFLQGYTHYTYALLILFIIIIAIDKITSKQLLRCQELFTLYVCSAFTVIVISCLFPCRGSMDRYADAATRLKFDPNTGTAFISQLMELRGTAPLTIDPLHLLGLAEFPSFHTAAAIFIIYSCRGKRFDLLVGIIVGLGMIAGTPIYGGHYFVDLIAGTAIALSAIFISRMFKRRESAAPVASASS